MKQCTSDQFDCKSAGCQNAQNPESEANCDGTCIPLELVNDYDPIGFMDCTDESDEGYPSGIGITGIKGSQYKKFLN